MNILKFTKQTVLFLLRLLVFAPSVALQGQFTSTTNADNTLTISGYNGGGGAVTIPTNINGLIVTGIGMGAFIGNTKITSVTIPGTVTSPGYAAFQGCSMLTNVIMYGLTSIADYMFSDCTRLTNAPIPPSVTTIGYEAFYDTALATISIPTKVTSIGNGAFAGCTALTNAILYGVSALGDDAFDSCTSLETVTLPPTISDIIGNPFDDCPRLTRVLFLGNFPDALSRMPDSGWVFSDNPNVTVYCLPGTSNWGFLTYWTGITPVLWNPQIQTTNGNFGVQSYQFGFDITGTPSIPIVVEACTNLANPIWTPLTNVTLTSGSFHFSDPQWTNFPTRYYGIGFP